MANKNEQPYFQPHATAQKFLTEQEMDGLIAAHAPLISEGKLAYGNTDLTIDWPTAESYLSIYPGNTPVNISCSRMPSA